MLSPPIMGQKVPGEPLIRNISFKQYKAHPQNWGITQNPQGVLFFGNTSGILEYDGTTWRLHKTPGRSVRSLEIDGSGRIYVGALQEFGYLEKTLNGDLKFISLTHLLPPGHPQAGDIDRVHITPQGIYFVSYQHVYYYDGKTLKIWESQLFKNSACIENYVFVPQIEGSIAVFHKGKRHSPYWLEKRFPASTFGPFCILPGDTNQMVIFTNGQGIYEGNLSQIMGSTDQNPDPLTHTVTPIDAYLTQFKLLSGVRLDPSRYALGTKEGGIVICNLKGEILTHLNKKRGLQNNTVHKLFVDKDKNLWAGLNIGITYLETSSPLLRFGEGSGIEDSLMTLEWFQDKLYVGGFFGVYILEGSEGKKISGYKHTAWSFLNYKGHLLVSGSGGIYHIQKGKAIPLTDAISCLDMVVSPRFPDYLFVTTIRGVRLVKSEIGDNIKLTTVKVLKEIPFMAYDSNVDPQGNLWFSPRYHGIRYLKFTGNSVHQYEVMKFGEAQGLPPSDVHYVCFIRGKAIVSSKFGIYYLNRELDSIDSEDVAFIQERTFGKSLADWDSYVTKIFPQSESQLFINSRNGFGIVTQEKGGEFRYNAAPFKQISGLVMDLITGPKGLTWIATDHGEGLFCYDHTIKKEYQKTHNTLIRKVTVSGSKVLFNGSYFSDSAPLKEAAVIDFKENSIAFEYSTPIYESPDATLYSYYLDGFSTPTSGWLTDTKKEYTNLPEGDYTFQVESLNIFGQISGKGEFSFSILPPWYRTGIAYFLYLFILLFMIAFALFLHRRSIREAVYEERKKHEKVALNPLKIEEFIKKLLKYMEKQKPYLDPSLSLNTLSKNVSIPKYQLSYIINNKLNQTFFEFLNQYRIKEAMSRLGDPEQAQTSILDVAYGVGFNSKSSFNIAFKKHTQITPLKYKKRELDKRNI